MSARGSAGLAKPAKKVARRRYATKTDIAQVTAALDRVRDDQTRYLICMTLDLITQQIAAEEAAEIAQPLDFPN
jgi:hypothetical protein